MGWRPPGQLLAWAPSRCSGRATAGWGEGLSHPAHHMRLRHRLDGFVISLSWGRLRGDSCSALGRIPLQKCPQAPATVPKEGNRCQTSPSEEG